jgi:hypothetical protein
VERFTWNIRDLLPLRDRSEPDIPRRYLPARRSMFHVKHTQFRGLKIDWAQRGSSHLRQSRIGMTT